MDTEKLVNIIGSDFYTGVPDSLLKPLCNFLEIRYGNDKKHHVIAANEGNATAVAAGYYLATGKIPVVYMQNSGEGNAINPIVSLLSDEMYAIPVVFIIGLRGEDGIKDEPQHKLQGKITLKLLEDIGLEYFLISKETGEKELEDKMKEFRNILKKGNSVAFVVKKDALTYKGEVNYQNEYTLTREEVIKEILKYSNDDPVISTTGKASRELFELRETNHQEHCFDFLTVGSMGHCSSIALGVALQTGKKLWCIDGDGAVLMHLGAMATIGAIKPQNFIHILINNTAHESVGAMPTAAKEIDFVKLAESMGYQKCASVDNMEGLRNYLDKYTGLNELSFIEVKCKIGSRENLGRPNIMPVENRKRFMKYLKDMGNNV